MKIGILEFRFSRFRRRKFDCRTDADPSHFAHQALAVLRKLSHLPRLRDKLLGCHMMDSFFFFFFQVCGRTGPNICGEKKEDSPISRGPFGGFARFHRGQTNPVRVRFTGGSAGAKGFLVAGTGGVSLRHGLRRGSVVCQTKPHRAWSRGHRDRESLTGPDSVGAGVMGVSMDARCLRVMIGEPTRTTHPMAGGTWCLGAVPAWRVLRRRFGAAGQGPCRNEQRIILDLCGRRFLAGPRRPDTGHS